MKKKESFFKTLKGMPASLLKLNVGSLVSGGLVFAMGRYLGFPLVASVGTTALFTVIPAATLTYYGIKYLVKKTKNGETVVTHDTDTTDHEKEDTKEESKDMTVQNTTTYNPLPKITSIEKEETQEPLLLQSGEGIDYSKYQSSNGDKKDKKEEQIEPLIPKTYREEDIEKYERTIEETEKSMKSYDKGFKESSEYKDATKERERALAEIKKLKQQKAAYKEEVNNLKRLKNASETKKEIKDIQVTDSNGEKKTIYVEPTHNYRERVSYDETPKKNR